MRHPWIHSTAMILLSFLPAAAGGFEYASDIIPAGKPAWQTPVDIDTGPNGSVFIAARDSGTIFRLMPGESAPSPWVKTGRLLHNLTIDARSGKLLASIGHAEGELAAYDLATSALLWKVKVGHTPRACVSHDGKIYVACQHDNDIAELDASGNIMKRHPVEREPVDLALTPDGKKLLVVNQLPSSPANLPGISSCVQVIDLTSGSTTRIPLAPGAHSAQSIAVTPDGHHAFVPSVLSAYHLPTSQIERGWIQSAGLNVIDLDAGKTTACLRLDDVDCGAANPWSCVLLEKTGELVISFSGTHELMGIRLKELESLLRANSGEPRQLGELASIRRRIPLPGDKSPRPLAATGTGVWYAASYSDTIGFLSMENGTIGPHHTLPNQGTPDAVRRGEAAFHDATLSAQHWLSCSSCHPGEARTDALNWDLLNDGIGNSKNTKSLVGAHQTPPTTWTGVRENAETSVRAGIQHSLFREVDESTANALDAYLSQLRPLPSPHRKNKNPELVEKGRRLFSERNCTDCHSGPYLTNQKSYDLGTGQGAETGKRFDVPTLREIWRTAPYLHDGRAATIEEAITELNRNAEFHEQCEVRDDEVGALAAYLKTL